jgi:hypothetical protein
MSPAFGVAYLLAESTESWPDSLRRRTKLNRFIALRQGVSLIVIALTAWLAALFLRASRTVAGDRPLLLAGWAVAWALSPPILTHGYLFFTEVPIALVALLCYLRRHDLGTARWGMRGILLGALTGFLVLLHVRTLGLVLAFVGLTIWRVRHDPRRLAGYAAGLASMATLKLWQNHVFWGTLLTTPHERVGTWPGLVETLEEMTMRGGAILFDGAHGLLLSAPVRILLRVGSIDAIHLGGLEHDLRPDFRATQGGGGIGREERVARARGEDHDLAFFEVADCLAADIRLDHLIDAQG